MNRSVKFCPRCSWFMPNEELGHDEKCPRCNSYCWEIFETKKYKNKKLEYSSAGISDQDCNYLEVSNINELKKIIDRAFYLMKRLKKR